MTGNLREPRPDDAVLGSTSGFTPVMLAYVVLALIRII